MSRKTVTLYHGTTAKAANKILRGGIRPSWRSGLAREVNRPLVYMTNEKAIARVFAGSRGRVLRVAVPATKMESFAIRKDSVGTRGMLVRYTEYLRAKTVPRSWITTGDFNTKHPRGYHGRFRRK